MLLISSRFRVQLYDTESDGQSKFEGSRWRGGAQGCAHKRCQPRRVAFRGVAFLTANDLRFIFPVYTLHSLAGHCFVTFNTKAWIQRYIEICEHPG